jgi:hypothetical protein
MVAEFFQGRSCLAFYNALDVLVSTFANDGFLEGSDKFGRAHCWKPRVAEFTVVGSDSGASP